MTWKRLIVSWLLTFSLFSYIGMASEITINPDKTISINGKKTFPVYTYDATSTFAEAKNDGIPEIAQRYDFTLRGWGTYWCGNPDWRTYQGQYEAAKLPYAIQAMVCSPCPSSTNTCWHVPDQTIMPFTAADRDAPQFFGYVHIDEPLKQRYENFSNLTATYNALKKFDPNHPVIVNHNPYDNTAANDYILKSQDYADIISEDHYTIRSTNPTRENYLYYFEYISLRTFAGGKSIDNYTKPFWAVVQANGKDAKDALGSIILKTTPEEVRLETFNAITIGYNGIGHWTYNNQAKNDSGSWENVGTWTDPVLWQGVKDLYNEIKELNDILVQPDVGRSWYQHENDATVLITHPELNKTISGYGTFRKLNYVLKRDSAKNIWYLIVVNKDKTSLFNVQIKVSGLTGNMTAKTLGTLGTGSSAPGRSITVNNGAFTDSFDGYAVHVYEVSSGAVGAIKYNANRSGITHVYYYGSPVEKPSISSGRKIYNSNCAGCHGEKGDGSVLKGAFNFTDNELIINKNSSIFFNVVTNGIPGTKMPSFGKLSTPQKWDVVAYLWTFWTDEVGVESGRSIYLKNCASCHGSSGDGSGHLGASDFTNVSIMMSKEPVVLFMNVSNGIKGTAMPPWKDFLSKNERWNAVKYIWTFQFKDYSQIGQTPVKTPSSAPTGELWYHKSVVMVIVISIILAVVVLYLFGKGMREL